MAPGSGASGRLVGCPVPIASPSSPEEAGHVAGWQSAQGVVSDLFFFFSSIFLDPGSCPELQILQEARPR